MSLDFLLLVRNAKVVRTNFIAKRCFSEAAAVENAGNAIAKAAAASQSTVIKIEDTPKPVKEAPKVEKEEPKKKKSSFRPFLYGSVFTVLLGYFFVYRQIWSSAHQMEQVIADISVDSSDKIDNLEQRVARLEHRME